MRTVLLYLYYGLCSWINIPLHIELHTNIKSKNKYIRFDHELLLEIDRARGQEKSFSASVNKHVEMNYLQ